jgi:hypothetical protein
LQRLDAVESSGRLPASTLRRLRLSCLESAEKEDPWPVQVHLSAPDSSAAFAKLAERFSAELQGRAASTYPHPAEEGRIPPREDLNLWAPVHDANLVRSTRDERARLSAQISLSPLARLSRPVSVMKFDPVLSVPKVLKSKFLSISSFEKLDVRALHVPHASPRTSKALSVVPYQKIEPKALSVVSYEKLDAKTVTIAPYERFRANWSHRAAVAESTAGLSIANFEKLDAKVLSLASFEKVESTALSVRSYEKILPKAHAYENFESTVLSLQPIQRVDSTALSVRPRTETRSALESLRASVAAARLGRGGPPDA